jgi:thiol-disulfide isomerase/thioredoxin
MVSDVFHHPLLDLDGRTTNLAAFRGQLTLLDFWGTWCPACIKGLPHLARLDREFGPRGLRIVGLAYEEGPPLEQTQRVRFVAQRQSVNYPLLLGTAQNCPLLRHFQVTRYPTLVLLDEQGQILWRGEGLGDANVRRLEELLRQRLGPGRS